MNIQPKKITESKTTTTSFSFKSELSDVHATSDDPVRKVLRIKLDETVPPQVVTVTGSEYEALGQWTDSSLKEFLILKFGLIIIPE